MEKRLVTVRVLGIMEQNGEREEVETLSDGFVRISENETEIVYKEVTEDEGEIKVRAIFTRSGKNGLYECRIEKTGMIQSRMLFIRDCETLCSYNTPFGELGFEIYTSFVDYKEEENDIRCRLKYILSSNGIPVSEAEVKITAIGKACS
ncbi:MAG: DUF1934 domain-containing protein [Lachnospiraceae bacterium]|nr:DUF1934 domain-containing protein [Lachnospiraceae bacterium]